MAEPNQQNVQLGFATGFQQVGLENFVVLHIVCGSMSATVTMPIVAARGLIEQVKKAVNEATTAIIKPVSAITQA